MLKAVIALSLLLPILSAQAANKYIIKLKPGVKSLSSINKSLGDITHISSSFGEFRVLETNEKIDMNSFNKSLSSEIEYIEPNYTYTLIPVKNADLTDVLAKRSSPIEDLINDPKAHKQWGLYNKGGFFSKKGEDINVINAWPITKGSKTIRIGVIDSGIDYTHEDLKDNMWTNEAELNGKAGVDDDGNGYVDDIHGYDFSNNDGDPMDDHSHGTHCAGVIGAAHNKIGVAGVNAEVELVGIKFLSASGSGDSEAAIRSIEYGIKVGVNILSNSWGGGERSQALEDAIKAANDAGIIFVAAAGNEYGDNDSGPIYPANYDVPNVITVGSHTSGGKKSGFSNYGQKTVHIMAPGSGILSTVPGDRYKKMSGTSMACPMVSGALGLLLANEMMTPAEAKERIIATAKKTSKLNGKTVSNGRLDSYRLLKNIRD